MTINNALKEQINLKDEIHIFKESTKPKNRDQKEKQALTSENAKRLLRGRPNVPNGFENKIFLQKNRDTMKRMPRYVSSRRKLLLTIRELRY